MLPIHPYLLPINPFSRPCKKLRAVKGIVMHYTASPGAPALNISRYFASLATQNPNDGVEDRYASAHYSVDDLSIYQNVPTDEMAYHCGSKTYTKEALARLGSYPNDSTIGIEMCIDKKGEITEKTFQQAVNLVSMLCKQFHLSSSDIWTHKGVVGWKDCPLPWVQNRNEFERFKKAVEGQLSAKAKPSYPKIKAVVGRDLPAIIVDQATHVIWTCLPLLNIKHEYKGNGLFLIQDRLVQGVVYEGDTYLPWGQISPPDLTPFQISGGWMFVYKP